MIHDLGDIEAILVASAIRFMRVFVNLLLGAKSVGRRAIMRRTIANSLLQVLEFVSIVLLLAI